MIADNRHYEKVGSEVKDITDDLPFEIPDSWVWTRLEKAAIINPRNNLPDDVEVSFVEMKAISDGYTNQFIATNRLWKEVKRGFTHFQESDVGFAKITPCFQNRKSVVFTNLRNGYGAGTTELHVLRPIQKTIVPNYLLHFVKSSYFIEYGKQRFSGTAGQQRFGTNEVKKTLLPLPPLAEQVRIVAEIEKFEPLIAEYDKLEQQATKLDEEIYDKLKKSILQYAIQGKLVPQDPNDEPASVLLERIRAEKKAKLGKKYVDSYIYKGDDNCYYEHIAGRTQDELVEVPFDIPYGWSWCRLANFAQVLGGKRIPAGRQLTNENTGHYYIKVSDMKENTICLDKLQFVPIDIYPTISRYIINKKDVYITVAGTIGRVGTIPNELDGANLTENADRIVLDEIDQLWLVKCLLSDVVQEQIKEATTKVGQPKLAIARIEKFLIPLPPLAEQKRIVAKINEIFAML